MDKRILREAQCVALLALNLLVLGHRDGRKDRKREGEADTQRSEQSGG